MITVLLTVVVMGIAVALLAIRVLLVRDGEFRGTCSANNPYLEDAVDPCTLCGKDANEPCQRWSLRRWKHILAGGHQRESG